MTNRVQANGAHSTIWTNAAHMVRNASMNARGNFFSLAARRNMPIEVIRDVLYQMQMPSPEYEVRIPLFNHQRAALLNDRQMQYNGGKKIVEGANPTEVHPHGMFESLGVLQEDFATPKGVKRPFEDPIVGDSGYQRRLDHLNGSLALPMAATPVSFGRGSYIKEARGFNGVYFNKWVARELDVSVNHAKRLLFAHARKNDSVLVATHVVSGWMSVAGGDDGAGVTRTQVVRLVEGAEALAAAFVHENRRDQRDAGAAAVGRHPDPAPAFSLSAAELLASPELI